MNLVKKILEIILKDKCLKLKELIGKWKRIKVKMVRKNIMNLYYLHGLRISLCFYVLS